MDSPPQFPAREAGTRPERHDAPQNDDQQRPGAGQLSRNGNPSLSAPTTELPDHQLASHPEVPPARHPVFTIAFVVLALYLGVIVVILPWRDAWLDNSLLDSFPTLHAVFANNFVRGLVSGLGVLDIWAAVSEAVNYRHTSAARH
jgi:hypothetical protein